MCIPDLCRCRESHGLNSALQEYRECLNKDIDFLIFLQGFAMNAVLPFFLYGGNSNVKTQHMPVIHGTWQPLLLFFLMFPLYLFFITSLFVCSLHRSHQHLVRIGGGELWLVHMQGDSEHEERPMSAIYTKKLMCDIHTKKGLEGEIYKKK